MRDAFSEWYWPDDEGLRKVVTDGLIVLDANVLLDLYRHSSRTRGDLLSALENEQIRPRLRLPYQAGLEFHRNRLLVVADHAKQYAAVHRALDELEESTEKHLGNLFSATNGLRDQGVREELERVSSKAARRLTKRVRQKLRLAEDDNVMHVEDVRVDDPLRDRIEGLFADAGQVSGRPSPAERTALEKAVQERLKSKLPPGTADSDKSDGGIGDPLIWLEMKELASETGLPVLFVSGDEKRDWTERISGKTLGPLAELRREFVDDTGQVFHKTTWRGLLDYVGRYLSVAVAAETLEVVEADEQARRLRSTTGAAGWVGAANPDTAGVLRLTPSLSNFFNEQRLAAAASPHTAFRELYPELFTESAVKRFSDVAGSAGLNAIRDAATSGFYGESGAGRLAEFARQSGLDAIRNSVGSASPLADPPDIDETSEEDGADGDGPAAD